MFDYIRCEMPMPEGAAKVKEWQTKDLDCSMTYYAIRANGDLVDECRRMEEKPNAPPKPDFLSSEWFEWRRKWWEEKVGPDVPQNYTGAINFYGYTEPNFKGEWWEFCAFIENGRCTKILQLEPNPPA